MRPLVFCLFVACGGPAAEVAPPPPALAATPPEVPLVPSTEPVVDPVAALPRAPDGTVMAPCPEVQVPGMVCVPGGPSPRGSDAAHTCDQGEIVGSPDNRKPSATVWVSTYLLDATEVTHQAYQACAKAGKCNPRQPSYPDLRRPQLPMTGVTWFEARDFCRAQGKRLPTEAEWEHAARGPAGEPQPWGPEPADCTRAVLKDASGRGCGIPMVGNTPEKGRPLDVMSRPAVRGIYDLLGNGEEWVEDWYMTYPKCGAACEGTDPRGPCAGEDACATSKTKLVKGGSWYWGPACATADNRRHHFPSNQPYHHFGFRCAASLDQAAALAAAPTP